MKTKHDHTYWIAGLALALMCTVTMPPAQANPAAADDREATDRRASAAALVENIRRITQSDASDARKNADIAQRVARAVVRFGPRAPRIIAEAAMQLDSALLPVVIAAATVAAGHLSPAMYEALLAAIGTTPELRETVTRYARNPALAIDPAVLATLPVMPMPPAVAPSPSPTDVHAGDVPLEVYERPVGEPPPPPRPPAPPYRGQ